MSMDWRLILDQPQRGDWNMAVDEAIMEHCGQGLVPPTLRLYAWSPPCLSLGYAQPYDDVDIERLHRAGWLLVRRPTGGRAILHTDELTYSLSAPAGDPVVTGSLLESYNRIAQALLAGVRSLGLAAEINPAESPDRHSSNPVCFEAPSAHEITVHGRKLFGSAQARRRSAVLQHGSLPLRGSLLRITQVLRYPDENARHEAATRLMMRATTVEAESGRDVTWDDASAALIEGFESALGIRFSSGMLSAPELQRAGRLLREKYAHPEYPERLRAQVPSAASAVESHAP